MEVLGMPDNSSILVVIIVFFAVLARATFGFGDALIAVPLLTVVVGIRAATPLIQLVGSTVALIVVVRNWQRVRLEPVRRLIVGALCGIPIGLIIVHVAPPRVMKGALGAMLIAYGVYGLVGVRGWELRHRAWSYLYGIISGIFGSAYSMSGPAVMVYGTLRRWRPEDFRVTAQTVIFPSGLIILIGHGLSGLWNKQLLLQYALCIPAVIGATALGKYLNGLWEAEHFVWMIYIALILLGGMLVS
jgi:uncharacterized protein